MRNRLDWLEQAIRETRRFVERQQDAEPERPPASFGGEVDRAAAQKQAAATLGTLEAERRSLLARLRMRRAKHAQEDVGEA
jgi:hypothetical protein